MKYCCFVISASLILVATGKTDKCQVVDVDSSTSCGNLLSYPYSSWNAAGGEINGSPIICGGSPKSDSGKSCYRFDQFENTWKFHAYMKSIRHSHAAAVIKDVLFISGRVSNGQLASTEFIHANGTVTSGTNLPLARQGHCMVTLHDGKVMILGAESPHSLTKNVILFDPSDSYTTEPSMSYPRNNAACTLFKSDLHDGRPVVLSAGGLSQATAQVYDYTNSNHWQTSIHLIISNM